MDAEEKKAYLRRYRVLSRRIDQTKIEIANWGDIATRVTPQYVDTPKGNGTADKVQNAAVEIAQLEEKLEKLKMDAISEQNQIKQILSSLENDNLRDLLWYHYICGLEWTEVAEKMHYDLHYLYALHRQAIKLLDIPETSYQIS